ncbi:hypothetical protein ACWGLC_02075 [Dietzia sp. NPDC055877]
MTMADPRLPQATLEELAARAREQGEQLEKLRLRCTDAVHHE